MGLSEVCTEVVNRLMEDSKDKVDVVFRDNHFTRNSIVTVSLIHDELLSKKLVAISGRTLVATQYINHKVTNSRMMHHSVRDLLNNALPTNCLLIGVVDKLLTLNDASTKIAKVLSSNPSTSVARLHYHSESLDSSIHHAPDMITDFELSKVSRYTDVRLTTKSADEYVGDVKFDRISTGILTEEFLHEPLDLVSFVRRKIEEDLLKEGYAISKVTEVIERDV